MDASEFHQLVMQRTWELLNQHFPEQVRMCALNAQHEIASSMREVAEENPEEPAEKKPKSTKGGTKRGS